MSIRKFLKRILNDAPEYKRKLSGDTYRLVKTISKEIVEGEYKLSNSKTYSSLKGQSKSDRKDVLNDLIDYLADIRSLEWNARYDLEEGRAEMILQGLSRQALDFTDIELIELFEKYRSLSGNGREKRRFVDWPIGFSFIQIEKFIKKNDCSLKLQEFLFQMQQWKEMDIKGNNYWGSDIEKVKIKLDKIVFGFNNDESSIASLVLNGKDDFGKILNSTIDKAKGEDKNTLYQMLHLAIACSGSKPSKKYLKSAKELIDKISIPRYKKYILPSLESIIQMKEIEEVHTYTYENGESYNYSNYSFFYDKNSTIAKGMVWTMVYFYDSKTLGILGKLAERSFKKIPGVGPAAAAVGNAAIYVLANSKGMEGVSHLSRLKTKIKQANTIKLIQKYINAASEKLGITPEEVEDLSIPDFELVNGKKVVEFEDYKLAIEISGIGKVTSTWIKPDGKVQKSVPTFVKADSKHKAKLSKLNRKIKLIKTSLTGQRDRLDRSLITERKWSYENFEHYYLNHGLMSFISHKLIWKILFDNTSINALYINDYWVDIKGNAIEVSNEDTEIQLWHPIYSDTEEVLQWRERLEELQIQQPLKQAFREVYIVTEAEINTKTYSNRMAAHLIKQHQFNALAGLRGWAFTLLGAWDHGLDGIARKPIGDSGITAEFWTNELNSEDAMSDSGIWSYLATDQVRWVKDGDPMDMIDIPKMAFTEIMRDVDLFVGVASVGNDPQWRDNGGLPQYHNYWNSYSFGDLTEVAKIRKSVLEKLIPRLKIRDVAKIDGKFLKVEGKIRMYKIHIGSSNILMEPNDQYLCIVPARGKDKVNTDNVFLPFEGDRGLSLVLSKAFLLSEDTKIKDPTILSQINSK